MKNAEHVNPDRRDFLKAVLRAGAVIVAPRAALTAGLAGITAAIQACGGGGHDEGSASAPGLASDFDVMETKVDGLAYGPNGQPPVQTGRHLSSIKFYAKKDLTGIQLGQIVRNPAGKVDWALYSAPFDVAAGSVYAMPSFDVPFKNSASGSYTLEHRIKVPGAEDVLRALNPQVIWGGQSVASDLKVSEAIDWLIRQYENNADPGLIVVVGDSAPASDVVAATEIVNHYRADATAKYGYANPVLQAKLASEKPSLEGNSGFVVGRGTNNPRVAGLLSATGTAMPADAGCIKPFELKDGSVYVAATGDISSIIQNEFRVRQAARALASHESFSMGYNKLKATGSAADYSDLAVAQA